MRIGRSWLAPGALALALLSLALNVYLIAQLRRPERWLAPAVERLVTGWEAEDAVIRYEVRLPPGTPIRADIPVDERFTVRVDTVIQVNTRVRVPFRSPFGTHSVELPIRAPIPLRTQLPLHIRHTFQLRTQTGQEIVVPLEIRLRDLPLDELLR